MQYSATDRLYNFAPPLAGLSIEQASEYILSGIESCEKEDGTVDVARATAWLGFCARCFLREPYGQDLARECRRFIRELTAASPSGKALADEPLPELAGKSLAELNGLVTAFVERGNVKGAYRVSSEAVGIASREFESWGKSGEVGFGFLDSIEFMAYVASHGGEFVAWHDHEVAHAFYLHGIVLYEMGEYANALKFHESALKADPVSSLVLLEMAECAKRLGEPDRVAEYAQQALRWARTVKEVAKAHRTIAYALIETNHLRWAVAHLKVAQDYAADPIGAAELEYVSSLGFDVASMSLEDAVRISNAETNGYPVSEEIESAFSALLTNEAMADTEMLESVFFEVSLWNRPFRCEYGLLAG